MDFATFFKFIFLVTAFVTVLMSPSYLKVEGVRSGEYYFLILCAHARDDVYGERRRPNHAVHRS